jgi:hypothetical protein
VVDDQVKPAGHIPQGYGCDEFLRDGVLITNAQPDFNVAGVVFPYVGQQLMEAMDEFDHMASLAVLIADSSPNGRVWRDLGGLPAITYNVSQEDAHRMHRGMVHAAEMLLAAGARRVYPQLLGTAPFEGERGLDAFRDAQMQPGDFVWTSYHPLGTCKMGPDPRTSVVDLSHEAHEVPGLFVVDGSTVPGPLGVNPQMTIMAMATRAARKIAERL